MSAEPANPALANATLKLQAAFTDALSLPPDTAFDNLAYRVTATWDSVAHMQLVALLEEAFDIMFETAEVLDMSSYAKARELLRGHGAPV